jgi:type VI secretion system ImpM family protein
VPSEALTVPAFRAGIFGKYPKHADFVRLGLSDSLADRLDRWAAAGLEEVETGSDWEGAWDNAAPWRFLLVNSAEHNSLVCGIVAASVDKAGRRFPFFMTMEYDSLDIGGFVPTLTRWLEETLYWVFEATPSASDVLAAVQNCCEQTLKNVQSPTFHEGQVNRLILGPLTGASVFWSLGCATANGGVIEVRDGLEPKLFTQMFGSRRGGL